MYVYTEYVQFTSRCSYLTEILKEDLYQYLFFFMFLSRRLRLAKQGMITPSV